jgi:hypothetical protein
VEMSNGTTVESDGMVLNAKTKEVTFEGQVRTSLVRPQAAASKQGAGNEVVTTDTAEREVGAPAPITAEQNKVPADAPPSDAKPARGAQP